MEAGVEVEAEEKGKEHEGAANEVAEM